MNFDGDAIRRKDGVTIVSIEQDGEGTEPDYILNYLRNGNLGYARVRPGYLDSFEVPYRDIGIIKKRINEDTDDQIKWQEAFLREVIERLEKALVDKKPVNLVIETVTKATKVAFIRKIEFSFE